MRKYSTYPRACVPLESFANYHLNVFAFSWLQARRQRLQNFEEGTETEVAYGEVPLLGLIGGKISLLALPSHAVSVSFSFGRHRYADLWRPWNTILMRPLLPLISSLCLAGDFRCSFHTTRAFIWWNCVRCSNIANLSDTRYVYAANLPNVKFRIAII